LYEFEGKEGVDVRGGEEALVVIVGEAVVGGIGHIVAAGAGDIGTVFLSIERIPTQIVYKFEVIADAEIEVSRVAWVVAKVVTEVTVAGAFAVVVHCLTCRVAVGVVESVVWDLHLRLRDRVCIVDS
jgi:hypothetical protein